MDGVLIPANDLEQYLVGLLNRYLVFLSNSVGIPTLTVADLCGNRWKIELLFRWIKQHLKIKSFFGTSPNAVKTQIWIAISGYVLVAILKKTMKIEMSLYTILQIFSVSLFEKVPIYQLVTETGSQNLRGILLTNCKYGTYNGTVVPLQMNTNKPGRLRKENKRRSRK